MNSIKAFYINLKLFILHDIYLIYSASIFTYYLYQIEVHKIIPQLFFSLFIKRMNYDLRPIHYPYFFRKFLYYNRPPTLIIHSSLLGIASVFFWITLVVILENDKTDFWAIIYIIINIIITTAFGAISFFINRRVLHHSIYILNQFIIYYIIFFFNKLLQ